uniref:Transcobalamin-1-like n=1 Tax=Salarias fasciatus TaxID=181472 RepID=A0A672IBT1_SALFA
MTPPALLSAALLLLLLPATLTDDGLVPFEVVVQNRLLGTTPQAYITHVKFGGILLGGLKRLMNSTNTFRFTYTEDPDYGPYLESVNGLARNDDDRTYWELLVKMTNGTIVRTNAGIGCYIPSENEQVILNF